MTQTETKSAIRVYLTRMRSKYGTKPVLFVVLALFVALTGVFSYTRGGAYAATSNTLNFQGRLLGASGSLVADGTYNIEFNLYTASSGGSTEWTEDYLNNAGQGVTVKNGFFSVNLGSISSFPGTINWDQQQWLGMTVRGTGSCAFGACTPTDAEMTPRFKLTAVPYAFQAGTALGVSSDATSTASTNSAGVTIQSGNATGATSNSGSISIDTGTATGTTGTVSLGTTNASGVSLGNQSAQFLLQGTSASTLVAKSGAFTTTFGFNAPTSNQTYKLPNTVAGTYDICTTANNCTALSGYIQNGTSLQTNANFNIQSAAAGSIGGIIRAATSQTADLLELQNSTGTPLTYVKADGSVVTNSLMLGGNSISNYVYNRTNHVVGVGDKLTVNGYNATVGATFGVVNYSSTTVASLIQGSASQTADLQEYMDSTGATIYSGVDASGNIFLNSGQSLKVNGSTSFPSSPTEGQVYFRTDNKQLYVYANGKWQADRSTATVIVAANDSQNKEKADYVATGTADQGVINTAITALPATGGLVFFLDGTYNVTGAISVPSNVTIMGSGASSIFKIPSSTNGTFSVFVNSDTSGGNTNIRIQNIHINGNRAGQSSGAMAGINLTKVTYSQVVGDLLENIQSYGVFLDNSASNQISGNTINNNGGSNIGAIDIQHASHQVTISNNTISSPASRGISVGGGSGTADNVVVSGNTITSSGIDSIYLDRSTYATVTGNTINSPSTDGIYLLGATSLATVTGNSINSATQYGILIRGSNNLISNNRVGNSGGSGSFDGIKTDSNSGSFSPSNNKIINNDITDTAGTGYAINIDYSTATSNYLSGNTFSGTGATSINDAGTSTIYVNQSRTAGGLDLLTRQAASTQAFTLQNASGFNALNLNTSTTVNLISNPGFEVGTTGWAALGSATLARDTTNFVSGVSSMSITTTAAANDGAKFNYALASTTQYTLSFNARLTSGSISNSNLEAGRAENGSTFTACTKAPTTNPSTAMWIRYSCTFTTGTTSGTPFIYIRQLDASGRTIYIDNVQLEASSVPSAFNGAGKISIDAVVDQPFQIQLNQDTTDAFAVRQASGQSVLSVDTNNASSPAGVVNVGGGTADAVLNVYGQAGNLTLYSGGNSGAPCGNSNVCLYGRDGGGSRYATIITGAVTGNNSYFGGTGGTADSSALITSSASNIGLVVKGAASQTADLLVFRDSTPTDLLRVSATGVLGSTDKTAASTNSADTNIRTGNASGATSNTGNLNLATGASSTSGNTGNVSITSGAATSGNSGNVTIDAGTASGTKGALSVGATNAASIALGHSGITTTVTGGLTQLTGAVSLTGNAASSFTTSSGALTLTSAAAATWSTATGNLNLDSAAALNLGSTNATSVVIGNTGNTASVSLQGTAAATYTVGTTNNTGGITIGNSTDTNTIAIGNANTATGKTQTINIGAGTPAGTGLTNINIGNNVNGGALTLTAGTGNINLNAGTIVGNASALNLFNTTATSVNAFGASTSTVLGATTGTLTVRNANQTFGNAAGSGVFTNNGATVLTTLAIADDSDGGALGGTPGSPLTAAQSVDVYTSFSVAQTTTGQTITLPTPTASTTYGRRIQVSNIGTASFIMNGSSIVPGSTADFVWSNTNGGASWQFAGDGGGSGNYIQNQNSATQTGNFIISGTGQAPAFDALASGALALGGTNATGLTLGNTANTSSTILQGTVAATYTIGTATGTGTITLGQSTAGQTINIGQATVATGNTQSINIGNNATGTGKNVVAIGSTNGASSLALNAGSGNATLNATAGSLTLSTTTSGTLAVSSAGALNLSGAAASTLNVGANTLAVTSSNFNLATTGVITVAGGQTPDITTASAGTSNTITVRPGNSTTNSGTGSNLILQGSNQTGTTSTGGGVAIDGGTGTSTNGAVNIGGTNDGAVTIGKTTGVSTITLGQSTAGQTINVGHATVATGNTQTINIGDSATGTGKDVITIGNTNGNSSLSLQAGAGNATLNATAGNLTLSTTTSGTLAVTSAGALNLTGGANSTFGFGANTLAVTSSAFNVTSAGVLTLGSAAGTGGVVNDGYTVNREKTYADFASGGAIDTAANSVDKYTYISVAQTTASQTLSLPTPTSNTTYGRIVYLANIGSTSFTFGTTTINPGTTATLIWSNTNGGASWQFAGADGNGILNQNTADQTANFRISGTGRANTSFTSPLFDSITGGVALGGTTATSVTLGNTTNTASTLIQGTVASTYTIGTATGTGTITLGQSTAGQTINIGAATVATGNTQTIHLGDSATGTGKDIITIGNTNGNSSLGLNAGAGGATLNATAGNLTVSTTTSGTLAVTSAGALNLTGAANSTFGFGSNTLAVTSSAFNVTSTGALSLGSAAGTGAFTNNGTTLNTEKAYANFATGGAIDTAANSVDKYTYFSVLQTTASQTLSIPTPTNNPTTVFGRVIYISNIGTVSFTLGGATINPGTTATLVWSNTDGAATGGESWQFAGADGNGILNQNAVSQTANFRITGTGQADTSFTSLAFERSAAGTLSVGTTSNTTGLTLGSTNLVNNLNLDSGASSTINIGSSASARTINVGNVAAAQTVTVGSSNSTSSLTLQAGTGALNIQSQGTGGINIGTNAVAQVVAIGNTTGASGITERVGTGNYSLDGVGASTFDLGASTVAGTVAIGGTAQTGATTLGRSTDTNTVNIATGATASGKTQTINIGTGGAAGSTTTTTIGSMIAGNITLQSASTINVNAPTIATNATTLGVFNTNASTVTAFQAGTSISIGATTGTLTVRNANQTFGNAAGSGLFTNNGATVNATLAVADDSDGGSLGGTPGSPLTAAQSVDVYTSISVAQTTAGQTITLPTPTASTAYGRILYLSNIGTASFTFGSTTVSPGTTATLIWSNTNGGASWQFAGADGNGILNQNTADQTANFRISGTGRANTSFTSPLFDSITGGVALGGTTATSVTLGNTTNTASTLIQGTVASTYTIGTATGTGTITLGQSTAGQTINIGAATVATGNTQTIHLGDSATGTGKDIITIGNTNGNSSLGLNAGAGGATLNATAGNLTVSTTTSGNISVSSAGTFALSSTNLQVSTAGVVTLAGGQTQDITTPGTGTSNGITIQPGTSTVNSGTGATLTLKGGNQSGTTSTGGSVSVDAGTGTTANGAVSLGATNAASIALGHSGITTTVTGGLTQLTGAVSLTGNAASSFTTSSGALTLTSAAAATWSTATGNLNLDSAAALNLGSTNATSVVIGNTGNTASVSLQGTVASTYTIGTATGTGTITLGQSTAGQTINIGAATVATGNTQTIHLGDSATGTGKDIITIGNTNGNSSLGLNAGAGGATLNATAGNLTVSTTTSGTLAVTSAGALNLTGAANSTFGFGSNTLAVTSSAFNVTSTGALSLGSAAGTGAFTNNGTTLNTEKAYANFATGGAIDTAANSVDKYTYFSVLQTTASQTLSIPTPTNNPTTVFGRVIYISNIGTVSFTLGGATINPGTTATLVWSNTDGAATGGESWQFAGADGNGILNQNAVSQTANFRITGTGQADTSFTSLAFERSAAGTLSVGTTSNTTGLTLGSTNLVNNLNLDSGASSTINIGSSASARTINVGNVAAAQTVTVGSTNSTSATLIQGGTGTGVSLQVASTGTIAVGTTTASTINVGTGAFAHTIAVGTDGTTTQGITIGSTSAASTTLIQGGTGTGVSLQVGTNGTIAIGTTTASTINLGTGAFAHTIAIGTDATTIQGVTIGSSFSTSATTLLSGSGALNLNNNNNQTTNINTGSSTGTVNIGNNTGNPAINIDSGTSAISIGTGGQARSISIGTGAAAVQTIAIGGTGANVLTIGNAQTGGSISIGGALTTGTVTVGNNAATGGTTTIQGGVSSSFKVSNATGTTVLGFNAPTTAGTVTYQLPTGGTGGNTYQICTDQNNCAALTGYVQNTTSTQSSANFNIQSAAAGSVGGVIQGASSQSADLLDLRDSTGANLVKFSATGNLDTAGYISNPYGGIGPYENRLTFSEDLNNAAWTATSLTAPAANTQTSPLGTTTAESLATTGSGGNLGETSATAPGATYTFSVWVKSTGGTQVGALRINGATTGTGTAQTFTATTTWQRVSVTQNTTGFTGNVRAVIYPGGIAGTGTIYAWGAQLAAGTSPLAYVHTDENTVVIGAGAFANIGGQAGLVSNGAIAINDTNGTNVAIGTFGTGTGTGLLRVDAYGTGGNTFEVRDIAGGNSIFTTSTTSGNSVFQYSLNVGGSLLVGGTGTATGDLSFANGGNRTINVMTPGSAGNGTNLTVTAAAANGANTGGQLNLNGGAASATSGSNGGAVSIAGAAGTATSTGGNGGGVTIAGGAGTIAAGNHTGGNISITSGLSTGSATGGTLTVASGAGGATGAGGTISITSGAGGSTSGASGAITLQSGAVTSGAAGNLTIDNGSGSTSGTPTVNLGNTNARAIQIGNITAATTTTINGGTGTGISLQVGSTGTIAVGTSAAATLNLGTGAFAHTIAVGTDNTTTQGITIGSTSASSVTTINGGTGTGVSIQVGSSGAIAIGSTAASTVNIGTGAFAHTVSIATDATTNQTVSIGSTSGTSSLTLSASGALSLAATGATFTTGARTVNIAQSGAATIGGALTVAAGQGGTGTGSVGGALNLQGGAAGGTNANGGGVTISGGAGAGTGTQGLVNLSTTAFTTAPTQTFSSSGVTATTATYVDLYSTLPITASVTGAIDTLTDPGQSVTGRIIYVAALSGSSDVTLRLNSTRTPIDITLKANSTATLIWNGANWSAAGASSSTDLQAAYNNTLSSAGGAEIVLNNTSNSNGLTIRNNASNPLIAGGSNGAALLEVQSSIGSNLFSINNNATEYASDGGAETSGTSTCTSGFPASTWTTAPAGGTCSRSTTTIATGQASAAVTTAGGTANQGLANTLSTALTTNLQYNVAFTIKGATNFTTLDVYYSKDGTAGSAISCTTGNTVNQSTWVRVGCTFTAPATPNSSNAIFIRDSSTTAHTFYVDNLSVTVNASVNHAADGSADSSANIGGGTNNWAQVGGATVAPESTVIYDTSGSVKVTTGANGKGVYNNLSNGIVPISNNTQYRVSFYARGDGANPATLSVTYAPNAGSGTGSSACTDYNTQTAATSTYTLISCIFTTIGTATANPSAIQITQSGATPAFFYVDALSVTLNQNTANNVQIGGANNGGPITLFTLDRSYGAPIAANNDAYLGSMYYDTSTSSIQCYGSTGWGACGAAPDNIVNLTPEFPGAVLNGSGVGTMTADFCANQSGVLTVNTSLCDGTGSPAVVGGNFYKWTSPQASQQTYSIYVSYQLPSTFKSFASDNTVQLTGRVDSTTNAAITYQMYDSHNGTLTQCGSGETSVTSSANTWQTVGINGNEATSCGFSTSNAGDTIIFKINMKANSNANAYVAGLSFTTKGK